ncbi:hypothetical protein Tco_0598173 [Tanacetum coccineum]
MESSPLMNAMEGSENVVENESHFSLEVVDQDLSSLAMFTKHLMGRGGGVGSNSGVGEGKEEFMGGIGGGSFAKHSMVAKDGLGGDGFVVDGGRSPSTSSKDGEDGGVENKSSMGSRLIVTGEFIVVLIGDSGGVVIGEVGGESDMCSRMVGGYGWIGRRRGIVKKDYGKAENSPAGAAGAILKGHRFEI